MYRELATGKTISMVAQRAGQANREIAWLKRLPFFAGACLLLLLFAGAIFADAREQAAKLHMQEIQRSFGITLAHDLQTLGHARITPETPADDAEYLLLQDTLRVWLKVNPQVESIYTFRMLPDGSFTVVLAPGSAELASDADNGQGILGQYYQGVVGGLVKAYSGEHYMLSDPTGATRGFSVNLFIPLYNAGGEVDAVLGLDFNDASWFRHVMAERASTMGVTLLIILLLYTLYWTIVRFRLNQFQIKLYTVELAESEARFRNLANHASVLLQVADADGSMIFFNQTWLDFTGVSYEEMTGRGWLSLIHPEDLFRFQTNLEDAMGKRRVLLTEFRLKNAEGSYNWMMATYLPRWHDAVFAGYMGSCVNITAHKRLEQALGYQVRLQQLFATITASFINSSSQNVDRLINQALDEIGRFAGADGCGVFFLSDDGSRIAITHRWCGPGGRPADMPLRDMPVEGIPWLIEKLRSGEVKFSRIADLPEAAYQEKAMLRTLGIQSAAVVPLTYGGRLTGFLGFHSINQEIVWREEHSTLLKITGEIFVNAIGRHKAEAALRKSEAQNRAIVDSVPDIMYRVSRNGVILDVKPVKQYPALATTGGEIGKTMASLVPAHLAKAAMDAVTAAFVSGKVQLFEYYATQESRISFFEARIAKAGEDEALVMVRDITERRRSEACDLLLLDVAVKVLEEQPLEDILVYACEQITRIFGAELLWVACKETGGSVNFFAPRDIAADSFGDMALNSEDAAESTGPTGAAIRTGRFQLVDIDDPRMTPWRERLVARAITSGAAFPLKIGGLILGALTVFTTHNDFWTKRTIVHLTNFAEQIALAINATSNRQQVKLLTAGLEAAANAVLITDRHGDIQWVNPAFLALHGYTAGEVLNKNIRILESGTNAWRFYRRIWQYVLSNKTWHGETTNRRKGGGTYNAEITITPVRDETGEIVNCIAIIQDITRRKQAEQEMLDARETMVRAERLSSLGIMAAGIAHEINQPLNSLKVMADGMLYWYDHGKMPDIERTMETVRKISKQADRIDSIIRHMRSFIKSSQTNAPVPCDINLAVAESLALLDAQMVAHHIETKTTLAAGLPKVLGNCTQFEEIIINLLINALQSLDTVNRAGKTITVTTGIYNGDVFLEVGDNGPGISKKHRSKIFEPFFTTKPAGEGMGLGLSIVYSIVTSYGGQISVKSNKHGDGVTFRLEFPAVDKQRSENRA